MKIKKRDIKFYLYGILTLLLIDLTINWDQGVQGFIDGYSQYEGMSAEELEQSVAGFSVFCEMVSSDAKPIALHLPMQAEEIERIWEAINEEADKYQVKIYVEEDFPVSDLFPESATRGKSVVLIYKGDRLKQYELWKSDVMNSDGSDSEELARRFGRLLGYTPQGINKLLRNNTDFRDLASFGVTRQITHLYYENLAEAVSFYRDILGLIPNENGQFQIGNDVLLQLNVQNDQHPKNQVKSTAIAFLTDQLPSWYQYIQEKKVPIKYTYKPREGGPHDGFVAIDPGGYLLEFEQFKQHEENELFMATFQSASKIQTQAEDLNFYGSITWTYHNDLLLMQNFYEDVLGFRLVADQGWTKIYQTSQTGFIGLVDERRGMEDYADTKAVEIEWVLSKKSEFLQYASKKWSDFSEENDRFQGPEKYNYLVTD